MDYSVCQETAIEEFNRFMEAMDMRPPRDAESLESFNRIKYDIIEAIMLGKCVVNDQGELVYTCSRTDDVLTFHEPCGADFMTVDKVKEGHSMKMQFHLLGAITKNDPSKFAKLKGVDLKFCRAVAMIFLA